MRNADSIPIVTFRELRKALKPHASESAAHAEQMIDTVVDDPLQAAAMRASYAEALKLLEQHERIPGVFVSPEHPAASLLQTFLAKESANAGKLDDLSTGGKEAKFDEHDWAGWAGSFFTWWKKLRPHPWVSTPEDHSIPNRVRIGIVGDWGTGLYGAPVVARTIDQDPSPYDGLVHLGDVYYSGDDDEVRERFLAYWPKRQALHRACNSNHEMYTGGHAYFGQTLAQFKQSASYFALHNDHWIFAGLDTAYAEKDLAGDQVTWLEALVGAAEGRRVVLFSHHQPYSFFDGGHPKITSKLAGLLKQRKVFAWYWGHEHRCALYATHPAWDLRGRCVGHGGYPAFRDSLDAFPKIDVGADSAWRSLPASDATPAGRILDGPNPYVPGHEARYGCNGYMVVEVDGPHLNEVVRAPDGTAVLNEQLV